MDKERIKNAIREIILAIGENPEREGLKETPDRIVRFYEEMFSGLKVNPEQFLEKTFKDDAHEELVLVKDIPFYSICEHHLVPFFGKAHVGYIPGKGKIIGLSKLARVVDCLAKRPQLQERLTSSIADIIYKKLEALGVIVIIEAEHLCMTMRGIKCPGSSTITSAIRGAFQSNAKSRAEVLALIKS